MTADQITKRITSFIEWAITSPLAFLLWLVGAVVIIGLGFGTINQLAKINLPTFGINPQTAVYTAGIVYLLHGKV